MEQSQRFKHKLEVFEKAVDGFSVSLQIETSTFPEEVIDAIKNGRIQKFEYCTELTWKIIKNFLYTFHNIDARSPRESIKEFFLIKAVNDSDYNLLIKMLDDRNKLSHIYKDEYFGEIHDKLAGYYTVIKKVLLFIKEELVKS